MIDGGFIPRVKTHGYKMGRADGSVNMTKKQSVLVNEMQRRSLGVYCSNGFQSVAMKEEYEERAVGSAHIIKLGN